MRHIEICFGIPVIAFFWIVIQNPTVKVKRPFQFWNWPITLHVLFWKNLKTHFSLLFVSVYVYYSIKKKPSQPTLTGPSVVIKQRIKCSASPGGNYRVSRYDAIIPITHSFHPLPNRDRSRTASGLSVQRLPPVHVTVLLIVWVTLSGDTRNVLEWVTGLEPAWNGFAIRGLTIQRHTHIVW